MPWKLVADPSGYIFTWLVGYSALLGPIAGILIADYFLVRRCQLDPAALYAPHGRYCLRQMAGRSAGVGALALAILPNLPGFLVTVKWLPAGSVPTFFVTAYDYAWFLGFAVAFTAYLVFLKLPGRKGT